MATIFEDMSRGCGSALVIRIIAVLIVVPLACGLICIPMWAFSNLDLSPWVMIIPAALFLLLLFGGGAAYMGIVLYRRKQMLDAAFATLGLEGKAYLSFFRQYHGTLQGRQVDVYLARGPRLEIEISTPLQTRLGVTGPHTDTRFAASLMDRQPMDFSTAGDPALGELTVFPHDEAWTRRLFADRQAAEIFKRLASRQTTFTRQQVLLRPGTWQLLLTGNTRMLSFDLDPAQVRQWIDDLLHLADIAEGMPDSTQTDVLSPLEQSAYRIRGQNPYLAIWVGVGTLLFFLIVTCVVAVLVAILANLN